MGKVLKHLPYQGSVVLSRVPKRLPTTTSVTSDGLHENDVDAKSQGLTKVDLVDGHYITMPI